MMYAMICMYLWYICVSVCGIFEDMKKRPEPLIDALLSLDQTNPVSLSNQKSERAQAKSWQIDFFIKKKLHMISTDFT